MPAERTLDAEAESEVAAEPKVEVAAEPETGPVVVAGAEAEVEAETPRLHRLGLFGDERDLGQGGSAEADRQQDHDCGFRETHHSPAIAVPGGRQV